MSDPTTHGDDAVPTTGWGEPAQSPDPRPQPPRRSPPPPTSGGHFGGPESNVAAPTSGGGRRLLPIAGLAILVVALIAVSVAAIMFRSSANDADSKAASLTTENSKLTSDLAAAKADLDTTKSDLAAVKATVAAAQAKVDAKEKERAFAHATWMQAQAERDACAQTIVDVYNAILNALQTAIATNNSDASGIGTTIGQVAAQRCPTFTSTGPAVPIPGVG